MPEETHREWAMPLAILQTDVKELDAKVEGLNVQVQRHEWQLQVLGTQWETMQKRVDFNVETMRQEMAEMKDQSNIRERARMIRENATLVGVILALVGIIAGFVIRQ